MKGNEGDSHPGGDRQAKVTCCQQNMFKESETIECKKSTAELKEAVISVVGMPNKHGRGEMTGRPCDPAGGPDQRSGKL